MKNHLRQKNKRFGFTLIEIMVASSIFIIVMFIAIGSILSVVDANRRAQALSSVVSNLNIALESMIRDIRTGTDYEIEDNGTGICFLDSDGKRVGYQLLVGATMETNEINKYSLDGDICQSSRTSIGSITAPEVILSSLNFTGRGLEQTPGDDIQPLVILQIQGSVGSGKYVSPFIIETLIAQRVGDNPLTVPGL